MLCFAISFLRATAFAETCQRRDEVGGVHATLESLEEHFWMTDFAAARKLAGETKRDLLVEFTGSDWCVWCRRLEKEVFETKEFSEVHRQFVTVQLDYPRKKILPEGLHQENRKLQETYDVQAFPSVLLITASGVVYGVTGYRAGGPEAYLKHLEELRLRGMAIEKLLAERDDPNRIQNIDEALAILQSNRALSRNEALIGELEKRGAKGLAQKWRALLALPKIQEELILHEIFLKAERVPKLNLQGYRARLIEISESLDQFLQHLPDNLQPAFKSEREKARALLSKTEERLQP